MSRSFGRIPRPTDRGALRVEVDEEHLAAELREGGTEVDGRGRLADPALLVAHGDDAGRPVAGQRGWRGEGRHGASGRPGASDPGVFRARQQGVGGVPQVGDHVDGFAGKVAIDAHSCASSPSFVRSVSLSLIGATLSAGPGVRLGIHLAQPRHGDHCVDLGGRHRGVSEQLLHDSDVGAAFEQVGGERVPQRVRRQVAGQARPLPCRCQRRPRGLAAEPRTPGAEEQGRSAFPAGR
jgi:hypothetical protein